MFRALDLGLEADVGEFLPEVVMGFQCGLEELACLHQPEICGRVITQPYIHDSRVAPLRQQHVSSAMASPDDNKIKAPSLKK